MLLRLRASPTSRLKQLCCCVGMGWKCLQKSWCCCCMALSPVHACLTEGHMTEGTARLGPFGLWSLQRRAVSLQTRMTVGHRSHLAPSKFTMLMTVTIAGGVAADCAFPCFSEWDSEWDLCVSRVFHQRRTKLDRISTGMLKPNTNSKLQMVRIPRSMLLPGQRNAGHFETGQRPLARRSQDGWQRPVFGEV